MATRGKTLCWLALIAGLTGVWGTSSLAAPAEPAAKLRILTSFLPVYCFTANVAGNLAQVENLLPSGSGPHDYQFAPRDLRKLEKADLFFVNGLGVEDWLERAVKSLGAAGHPKVVTLSAGLKNELLEQAGQNSVSGQHHHSVNPHIWLDPQLAAHAVSNVIAALSLADPANAAGYRANGDNYLTQLRQLDAEICNTLGPVKTQPIVTYHNAFPYFIRRYGLTLAGVVEEVPDVEPSPRQRAALQQLMRARKVKVLFTEPQFSSKLARQIADDVGIPLAELDTLETGPLKPAMYEEIMRRNAQTLLRHLK